MAKKKFNDRPFAYHQELELEITTLTNLGIGLGRVQLADQLGTGTCDLELPPANAGGGLGRVPLNGNLELGTCDLKLPPANAGGWVVMVPFSLPGERIRARVFRNHQNYSEADLVAVLTPSPHRIPSPRCPLFGRCGGCQYQHLVYAEQLEWKRRQVAGLLLHMAGVEFVVTPVIGSPRQFGYRSKITPHFAALRRGQEVPGSKCQVPKKPQTDPKILQTTFSAQNPEPRTQNPELETQNSELRTQNPELRTQNPELRAQNPELRALNSELRAQNSEPRTQNLKSVAAADFPIGFLRQGSRHDIIDVPRCEIATDAINLRLAEVRAGVRARASAGGFPHGATLLLRDAGGTVTTDYAAVITEEIAVPGSAQAGAAGYGLLRRGFAGQGDPALQGRAEMPTGYARPLRLRFLARDFFQNNPFILPSFAGYVRDQAAASGARFLIDAYCGSGLFALASAAEFQRVAGIEVSETSVAFARENATANGIVNASFLAGDAAAIFAGVDFPAADTVVVIDPPRKGCDEPFLQQLFSFSPRAVVYVSCDPATQMRDLGRFLAAGYALSAVQPFDLFPQTRHLECVMTLKKSG